MVIYLYKVFAHDPTLYIYIYDHIRDPRPSKKKKSDNVVFKSTTFIYLYKVSAHDPYILYIYIYDHIRGPRPPKKIRGVWQIREIPSFGVDTSRRALTDQKLGG